ncbi:MAG: sirohydrochlorin chelatase [Hyphomicrobiales bacterium]|nr:MAG: sirohydrochlorin chelatase [Hyphomicrobiales bacterium]
MQNLELDHQIPQSFLDALQKRILAEPQKTGIMICGHGSRDLGAVAEFSKLSQAIAKSLPNIPVDYGYLEFATPIIKTGLKNLQEQGVTRVLAIPGMLFAAGHAKNDIPSVLNTYAVQNDLQIDYGRDLSIDTKMIRAASDRVKQAINQAGDHISNNDTLLMVIGRGASDPDANSNVNKVMRLLWEGLGLGWGEVGYSGVTFPLVQPALEHAVKLGYKRIITFPYFLFTGILVDRIYAYHDKVAADNPDIEFIKAPYLNDHPLVIETFLNRVLEILDGDNAMNCGLCKYREQVLGFEDQIGLPQESHHHHVEGINDAHSHDHGHSHSHSHDHDHDDHTHHPYPHADHPHGPATLDSEIA